VDETKRSGGKIARRFQLFKRNHPFLSITPAIAESTRQSLPRVSSFRQRHLFGMSISSLGCNALVSVFYGEGIERFTQGKGMNAQIHEGSEIN